MPQQHQHKWPFGEALVCLARIRPDEPPYIIRPSVYAVGDKTLRKDGKYYVVTRKDYRALQQAKLGGPNSPAVFEFREHPGALTPNEVVEKMGPRAVEVLEKIKQEGRVLDVDLRHALEMKVKALKEDEKKGKGKKDDSEDEDSNEKSAASEEDSGDEDSDEEGEKKPKTTRRRIRSRSKKSEE